MTVDGERASDILDSVSTVTVNELHKNLEQALRRVERGETVRITRRRRTIATLMPAPAKPAPAVKAQPWPDLAARSAKIMARGKSGEIVDAGQFIIDSRGVW